MKCSTWLLLVALLAIFGEISGRPPVSEAEQSKEDEVNQENTEVTAQEDAPAANDPFENIQSTTDTAKEVENAEQESNESDETFQARPDEETGNTDTPSNDEDSTEAMDKLPKPEVLKENSKVLSATATVDKTDGEQVPEVTTAPRTKTFLTTSLPVKESEIVSSTEATANLLADPSKPMTLISKEILSVIATNEAGQTSVTEAMNTEYTTEMEDAQEESNETDALPLEEVSSEEQRAEEPSQLLKASNEYPKTTEEPINKPTEVEKQEIKESKEAVQPVSAAQNETIKKVSTNTDNQLKESSDTELDEPEVTATISTTTASPSKLLAESNEQQPAIPKVIPASVTNETRDTATEETLEHKVKAALLTSNATMSEDRSDSPLQHTSESSEHPEVAGPGEEILQSSSSDQDGTDLSAMKAFSFDLPIYNQSIHKELMLNESEWTKELAESTHPDEEHTIHDPCTFISENIHKVVGLNVTKEQVHNTLPTFRFLLDANTEELTTIKEMLLGCVEATEKKKGNTDPGCQKIRSLISKTCHAMDTCKNQEEQLMSKVMERIREVVDSDQLADALLMIRACAGQTYE